MNDDAPAPLDLAPLLTELRKALLPTLGAELTLELALPMLALAPDATQREERASPAAIVSLGVGPRPDAEMPWLWLDAALATNLVDRALGGRGQLGVATTAALPSDAECGVLAYLAARAVRGFECLWVRDVYATDAAAPQASVIWPVSLRWQGGTGVARFGCGAAWSMSAVSVQIGWLNSVSPRDRDTLEVGDVLTCEDAPLSVTTQGLATSGVMRMAGVADTLRVVIDGAQLHGVRAERSKTRPDELFVVMHDLTLSIIDIAKLAGGGCITVPNGKPAHVSLRQGERTIAGGELVQVGSAVGVRIQSLPRVGEAR